VVRQQLRKEHTAAVHIQSSWRRFSAQRQYQVYRSSSITVQSHWR
jgi:hypothetical protein